MHCIAKKKKWKNGGNIPIYAVPCSERLLGELHKGPSFFVDLCRHAEPTTTPSTKVGAVESLAAW